MYAHTAKLKSLLIQWSSLTERNYYTVIGHNPYLFLSNNEHNNNNNNNNNNGQYNKY